VSQRLPDYDDYRARQARAQEPATHLSEWEIAGRRALFECGAQLTTGNYNINRIRDILEKAGK
jgi:hypothetical protein